MSAILTIDKLNKTYGSRQVLRDFSLTVDAGESVAITGRSGSGKSTILNIIGLLESPDSGTIRLANAEYPRINSGKATKIRRNHISYLFQSYALLPGETALQNVLLGMKYAPGSKRDKRARAEEVLARLGLSDVINDRVYTLSGGEQQRVALARCVLKPGELILADEPTGALDGELAQVVLSEMIQLQHEYGKSLIVVSHDPAVAAQCDRIVRLR